MYHHSKKSYEKVYHYSKKSYKKMYLCVTLAN